MNDQLFVNLSNLVYGYHEWAKKQPPQEIDGDPTGDPGTYFDLPESQQILKELFPASQFRASWRKANEHLPETTPDDFLQDALITMKDTPKSFEEIITSPEILEAMESYADQFRRSREYSCKVWPVGFPEQTTLETYTIHEIKALLPAHEIEWLDESTPSPSLADNIWQQIYDSMIAANINYKDAQILVESWRQTYATKTNSTAPPIPPDISAWIKDEATAKANKWYPNPSKRDAPFTTTADLHGIIEQIYEEAATELHNLLSPKLTAQEQRIKKLEEALNAINAFDDRGDLNPQTQARFSIAIAKFALGLSKIVPGDAVSDTRDGDSKENPDQKKPDLAEQLRAMNPHKRGVFANGYNFACNKLNEIINDKK